MRSMICNLIWVWEVSGAPMAAYAKVANLCTSTPTFSVHFALICRTTKIRLMHCSRLVHFYIRKVYYI